MKTKYAVYTMGTLRLTIVKTNNCKYLFGSSKKFHQRLVLISEVDSQNTNGYL